MWEYVKGSEADFIGAPEWANFVITGGEFEGLWFLDTFDGAGRQRHCRTDLVHMSYRGLDNEKRIYRIIAERRKVHDLQSRTNDANLQQAFDSVQRPAHYNQSGIECIDAIAAAVKGKSGIEAALVSNVIKYLWRYELKNGVEDVRKAQWYLDRLVKELSK